eukprot:augustus_masked-scaffold_15-processed-gene-10.67-mRNA-1 protein AED:0.37 eAED:0.45 QI:0/-1/0/1/-1/1/1/0/1164
MTVTVKPVGVSEGLEKDMSVGVYPKKGGPFPIKGSQPIDESELPFIYKHMSFGKEFLNIQGEMVYPFSAEKCFSVMTNYLDFLSVFMYDVEKEAREGGMQNFRSVPQWERCVPNHLSENGPGSAFRYSYFDMGKVFSIVEEIKVCDDSEVDQYGQKVYKFGVHFSNEHSIPMHPAKDHNWLMVFTTYQQDPNKCHLRWTRRMRTNFVLGWPVGKMTQRQFETDIQRHTFILWRLFHRKFSNKLPKKDSKVVIVGAGPSGLHMAHLLIQKGLPAKNITILEKTDRYGGKTLSILDKSECQLANPQYTADGELIWGDQTVEEMYEGGDPVFHELGTCYMSPGYFALRQMLKDLQKVSPTMSIDLTAEVGPDTYAFEGGNIPPPLGLTMDEWIYQSGKDKTNLDEIFGFTPRTKRMAVNAAVLAAKLKYCKLHQEMMGSYYYTIPARPQPKMNDKLKKKFGDFLREEKLDILLPLFTYACTAQGYGLIDETPTYWGMCWMTPDLLDGYFEWYEFFLFMKDENGNFRPEMEKFQAKMKETGRDLDDFDNPRKAMVVAGWLAVWDRIVDLHGLRRRMKLNADIANITRAVTGGDASVTVNYTHEGNTFTEDFDFLVMAAPMSDAYQDSTVQTFPLQLTSEESSILLSDQIVGSTFRTNLFKPPQNGHFEKDHLRIFTDAILQSPNPSCTVVPGTGDVFGVRDSYKAIQPMLSTKNGNKTDPLKDTPREKMCYQYVAPSFKHGPVELKRYLDDKQKLFFNEQKTDMGTYDQLDHLHSQAWTYFTHFEGTDMDKGSLWNLMDLQGKNNTFFVHASNNFESVLDIVNYNNMLFDGLTGELDSLLKPEADKRPEEYQRPQQFLLNVENSRIRNLIRTVLNIIIGIIWTLFYIISYPLAEGYYLRKARYELQVAFETQDLGNPLTYDMKKFLSVSPTVRGYVDFFNGKPNGMPPAPLPSDYDPTQYPKDIGPGDGVFKIIQAPMHGFNNIFTNIPAYPEVQYSMQWNLQDFRTGIRFWLGTFEDGFMPFLGPWAQAILAAVGAYAPNMNSWVFSWVFATQFRLLVGYSYRFEDAMGGGLYIPDCHMLKEAIQEYGVEAGQRICLTVCKVFTEEVMREKRMKIDFQPDFIHYKTGNGCTVRVNPAKEHAYSDHTLYESRNKAEKEKYDDFTNFNW